MKCAVATAIPVMLATLAACTSCANVDVRFGPDDIDNGLGYWKYGAGDRPIYSFHWLGDSVSVRDGYEEADTYTITASACAGLNEARTKLLRDAEQRVAALLKDQPLPPPAELLLDAPRHRLVFHPPGQLERLELSGFDEMTRPPWIESAHAMRKIIAGCRES